MKKVVEQRSSTSSVRSRTKSIILTLIAVIFILFVLLPISLSLFNGSKTGNVAIIPIEGVITGSGDGYMGSKTLSSQVIVGFIEEAIENPQVEAIILEINSPGGSAVASDEIATAIKKSEKPSLSIIREVGASGGYWVASATDHIIANRMSITGSIGVISSYLEFSGLMEKYGVGYERMVAGKNKDIGTPFKKLEEEERIILQSKLDKIHQYFIQEIAENRNLPSPAVKELATGEFYLGIEAKELGLIDQLGDLDTAEEYLKKTYQLEEIDFVVYESKGSIFDVLGGVVSEFFFKIGEGLGSILVKRDYNLMLM